MSEEITKKILKEMEQMSKGGEGSGQKGHKTLNESEETYDQRRERLSWAPNMKRTKEEKARGERGYN